MSASRTWATLLVAAATSLGVGGSTVAAQPQPWSLDFERVSSPAGFGSRAPRLSASDQGIILSWFAPQGDGTALRFSEWTTGRWSMARTAAAGDNWFVSQADLPAVVRMSDGTLVAQWLEATIVEREAYDLMLSYSTDDGRTWAPTIMPHHDETQSQHGFASLFEMPGEGLGLVWLDGRSNQFDVDNPNRAAMMLRFAAFDRDWEQVADEAIDLRVCECCPTSTAVTSEGILATYRDRSDNEIRDIFAARLEDGTWTAGVPVHNDNWEFYACPVNGPAVSARGRQAAVAWFTVKEDQGQAYAAFSSDAGRSWGPAVRIDDAGSLGRVDIELLDDGSAVASWVESSDRNAELRIRRIGPSGARSPAVVVTEVSGAIAGGYPQLALDGHTLVVVWTGGSAAASGQSLGVQTAVAILP